MQTKQTPVSAEIQLLTQLQNHCKILLTSDSAVGAAAAKKYHELIEFKISLLQNPTKAFEAEKPVSTRRGIRPCAFGILH